MDGVERHSFGLGNIEIWKTRRAVEKIVVNKVVGIDLIYQRCYCDGLVECITRSGAMAVVESYSSSTIYIEIYTYMWKEVVREAQDILAI